ncbi:MAG: magnesium transporter [Lachnospiraceae bacterium]|nr:magnesium transporter [Lachnospiraceae bacterium]MBR2752748.1 magnesium transporter [Lachnospiraceae bacterium]
MTQQDHSQLNEEKELLEKRVFEEISGIEQDEAVEAPPSPERPDYAEEILEIIRSDKPDEELFELLDDYHDNDLADALELMTPEERSHFYKVLPADVVADIYERLDQDEVEEYLSELDDQRVANIVDHMDADKAVDFLKMLSTEKRMILVSLLDRQSQKDILMIAQYDEDQIGSRMSTNYVSISKTMTVKNAMRTLVRKAADYDNVATIYVVDEEEKFYGAIELTALIIAREGQSLDDLVQTSYPYVYASEQIDDCIEDIKDYSEDSIPVLDNDNHMIGVITSQDLVQVVDDEMGEDYARLAGLTAEEDLKEPLFQSMKKRLPWLMILLFLGLLVSSVIANYEKIVAQLTILMVFQSMILDMSGNAGIQSLGVTIRVLSDETLTFGQKIKLVFKEIRVGLCNGLLLGLISFTLIGLYIMVIRHHPALFSFAVSGCIGLALLGAMLISSFMGTVIPIFFNKIGVDPAVASGPLITTVNDLVAVVTYYSLSYVLLIQVLNLSG